MNSRPYLHQPRPSGPISLLCVLCAPASVISVLGMFSLQQTLQIYAFVFNHFHDAPSRNLFIFKLLRCCPGVGIPLSAKSPKTRRFAQSRFSTTYELPHHFTPSCVPFFSTAYNSGNLQPLCFHSVATVGWGGYTPRLMLRTDGLVRVFGRWRTDRLREWGGRWRNRFPTTFRFGLAFRFRLRGWR